MLTLILFSSHLKTARKVYCQILDRQQTSAKPMWDQLLQKKKKTFTDLETFVRQQQEAIEDFKLKSFNLILYTIPGVSTKINGIQQCESAYEAFKSNGGGSTYSFPSCSLQRKIGNKKTKIDSRMASHAFTVNVILNSWHKFVGSETS